MKIVYPNYENCLTNVINSILKNFEIEPFHTTLKYLDDILENNIYKNVVLILNDGLGTNILKRNLDENDFLIQHLYKNITSVFPATTTASTTSVITGLNPVEHNWLGWDVYIKDIDKTVTLYLNKIKDTEELAADYNVGHNFFPYTTVFQLINSAGKYKAYGVSPYEDVKYSFSEPDNMYNEIKKLCNMSGKKYIYTYYNEPDYLMHDLGVDNIDVKNNIKYINNNIEKLSKELKDTLIIVTADHGHINVEYEFLTNYPSIKELLVRDISIESRATNFFVKSDKFHEFETEFNKYLGKYFLLLTKQEIIEKKLFGTGKVNERFYSCIGDYMALGIGNKSIAYNVDEDPLKSNHAGITEDEVVVPLIIIDTNKINNI